MRVSLKRDSAAIFALIFVHLVIKQRLVQLKIEPLRMDPCDAVSVFALLTIALAGGVLFVRLIAGHASDAAHERQRVFVVRAQQAVVSAILLTLAANAVALARHPALWIARGSSKHGIALLCVVFAAATAVQYVIARSQRRLGGAAATGWKQVAGTFSLSCAILCLCPEWPTFRASITAHVLTVTAGALVLLIATRCSVLQLVPSAVAGAPGEAWFQTGRERASLAAGIVAGALGFWAGAAAGDGGVFRYAHPAFFIVITSCAIAYACMAAPLGIAGVVSRRG